MSSIRVFRSNTPFDGLFWLDPYFRDIRKEIYKYLAKCDRMHIFNHLIYKTCANCFMTGSLELALTSCMSCYTYNSLNCCFAPLYYCNNCIVIKKEDWEMVFRSGEKAKGTDITRYCKKHDPKERNH